MITGESKRVHKMNGTKVIAGTINGEGCLRVRLTATGSETTLAGIMRLVEQAQQSKSRIQVLADKAAGWLFYIALAAALVTTVAWTLAEAFNLQVLERVVTMLVIACPHALGLAIPLVVAITPALGTAHVGQHHCGRAQCPVTAQDGTVSLTLKHKPIKLLHLYTK